MTIDVKNKLKILVVDDHPIFRNALSKLIINLKNVELVLQASNGQEALDLCENTLFDFVFLDLEMPVLNGQEFAKKLKNEKPKVNIVVVSMIKNKNDIIEMLNLGVNGFILKSTDEDEMKKAIDLIIDGNQYLTKEVKDRWVDYLINKNIKEVKNKPKFSDREIEIMKLLADQLTTKEIADKLCIAESTLNTHKKNLMSKIETDSSIGIIMFAIRNEYYIP